MSGKCHVLSRRSNQKADPLHPGDPEGVEGQHFKSSEKIDKCFACPYFLACSANGVHFVRPQHASKTSVACALTSDRTRLVLPILGLCLGWYGQLTSVTGG